MRRISFIAPELKRLDQAKESTLAFFRFAEQHPLAGLASLIDWRVYGHLSRLVVEGFLRGDPSESLLMPLGRHLFQEVLLVFGLGDRELFDQGVFLRGIKKLFDTMTALNRNDLVLVLPGRNEQVCETTQAMEWFLDAYEEHGNGRDIQIAEPLPAQKLMLPVLERWRLRQLVP